MQRELDDPLKPLATIFDPDERQAFMVGTLIELHKELSALELSRLVPKEVRQLFETAKNVRLYAFFAFRLHQLAEMGFYQSLELALRSRRLIEDHNGATPQSSKAGKRLNLGGLLKEAAACGWIHNAGFSMRNQRARNALVHEKAVEAIERAGTLGGVRQLDRVLLVLGRAEAVDEKAGRGIERRRTAELDELAPMARVASEDRERSILAREGRGREHQRERE